MKNFVYSIPTKIYFGKGQVEKLGSILAPYGRKVLLVYGGGSIKRNGIYDTVTGLLAEAGIDWEELSGVEPNPRITTVREGARLCREKGIEVVLPIGGGSTIDCGKMIAAAACYDGDAWDLVVRGKNIRAALPVVTILTLAATGSEMDTFAVISDIDAHHKIGTGSPLLRPAASIMDPSYTESVSAVQTAAGTADIMSHIFEAYFSDHAGYMQDRMAEGLLKTCIAFGVKAVAEPNDYEARANLMWASSWAINDFLSLGKPVAWSVHPMEHELSAYYDITHGVGLAILTPHWMRYVLDEKTAGKFREYGVNVWGIDPALPAMEAANQAIDRTEEYFRALGLPATLREVGIDERLFDEMAGKVVPQLKYAYRPLQKEEVIHIYEAAL